MLAGLIAASVPRRRGRRTRRYSAAYVLAGMAIMAAGIAIAIFEEGGIGLGPSALLVLAALAFQTSFADPMRAARGASAQGDTTYGGSGP